jgi:hypothetical protein
MRTAALSMLAGLFICPDAFWPSGCTQTETGPVVVTTAEPGISGIAEEAAIPEWPFLDGPATSPAETSAEVDPLVPPIVLDGPARHVPNDPLRPIGIDRGPFRGKGIFPGGTIPVVLNADFSSDDRAHFHPHGEKVCASGCAASNHPTPNLAVDEFRRLMLEFSSGPMDETNPALESLLYYGRQTQTLMKRHGTLPLSAERVVFLQQELRHSHAIFSFRVVDEHGVVRTQMRPTRIPFDRRHVFEMEVKDLPPLVTSGTVKRVGLHHLWTRL